MQYFPDDKILEKKDLREGNTNRLFKILGFGKSSQDLREYWDISLGDEQQEKGSYLLVLKPRRRALEKRFTRFLLWVGDQNFLPNAMKLEEANGDFTHFIFRNVELNSDLAANTFHLDIPAGVQVRDELKLFSAAKGEAN
jgi:outer membrane lipoprotein-sorting protein